MTAPNARERILPRLIDEEIKESFINYSMSVIVSRALPDVRDGLKPVHRRVLYAMNELGLVPGRPYKKCATVVGDVLGKYHPHGDSSVYDALVRMAQDFSLRYLLVDPQGNFGSIDGDSAAAYRYTEARMTRLAVTMLADIDKNTVDFAANFDDRLQEPRVLPAGAPNLLVNGSAGIAVGMATNIPPHNMREVVDACIALIDDPTLDAAALRRHVKGPDFPTGGYIYGRAGIADYQDTGRGRIVMRARAVIEEKESSGKSQIVVTEVPYQVNKAKLVKDIADLVRDGKLTGISALRDESDRDGIRVVIELKRDAIPRVVLNQLYKHTAMQSTFGVIMLALVPDDTGRLIPRVLSLKQVLEHYLAHRHEVVVRRTQFDLDKALEREHILEGLKIAVDNIDEVIALIRAAEDTPTASTQLQARFGLSERQAEAILNMRLAKLTGLERDKLEEELREVRTFIAELRSILESREKRMEIMKGELLAVRETFGDDRRTEIVSDEGEFTVEDLIAEEEMVVTISRQGYIKRTSVSLYRRQGRGGKGKIGADLKDGDFVEQMYVTSTHNYLLIFTDDGRCYWLKVHELPQAGRATRGKPIVNLINVTPDTRIRAIVPVREFSDDEYLLFCTSDGTVKKTALSQYSNVRANGVKAIKIEDGDRLIDVQVTNGTNDIVLGTASGLSIRFHEQDVREMGRDTTGVKGITLGDDDRVVGMVVIKRNEATLLVATERGLGKCTSLDDYRIQKRGGKGILTLKRTEKTGNVVALMEVSAEEEIMLITRGGVAIRSSVKEVRVAGRNTQGVKLVSLDSGDLVTAVARMVPDDEKDDVGGEDGGDAAGADGELPLE
ncbi:MAG: DNA gyrase subunit A [Gemmatimonadaceae bacterium]|nr:DNA gyrase subunit A [Gemmatimonadaceae bacterium]